jgi:hypothetical protein
MALYNAGGHFIIEKDGIPYNGTSDSRSRYLDAEELAMGLEFAGVEYEVVEQTREEFSEYIKSLKYKKFERCPDLEAAIDRYKAKFPKILEARRKAAEKAEAERAEYQRMVDAGEIEEEEYD